MPNESTSIEFFHWEKTQKCPFVVYADLEAINVASTVLPTATHTRTREVERQYPASYGAESVDSRSKLSFFSIFIPCAFNCGRNCKLRKLTILFQAIKLQSNHSIEAKILTPSCWIP